MIYRRLLWFCLIKEWYAFFQWKFLLHELVDFFFISRLVANVRASRQFFLIVRLLYLPCDNTNGVVILRIWNNRWATVLGYTWTYISFWKKAAFCIKIKCVARAVHIVETECGPHYSWCVWVEDTGWGNRNHGDISWYPFHGYIRYINWFPRDFLISFFVSNYKYDLKIVT